MSHEIIETKRLVFTFCKSKITFDKLRNRCRYSKFTPIIRYNLQDIAAKLPLSFCVIICFLTRKNEKM